MVNNNGSVPMRGANPTTVTGFGISSRCLRNGVGTPAATAGTTPSAEGASRIPGSAAVANGFGPANFRANFGQNGPGRAGNLPARGGSQNGNSTFQGSTSPFAPNSFLGIMSSLPPSAFSPNVAAPTPPGRASRPQTPSYYPLYLPNGSINQNVGPNAPMANGQVTGGDAAALTQAAQENATRNGMVFQNGQWWAQSPTGNWEYYRGTTWNSLSPGAIKTPGVSTPSRDALGIGRRQPPRTLTTFPVTARNVGLCQRYLFGTRPLPSEFVSRQCRPKASRPESSLLVL